MRRDRAIVSAVLALTLVATPLLAQDMIRAFEPSFSWTGKQDQQANYTWSSTLTNPSRRDTTVIVTLQLVDSAGNVVGADTKTVSITRESEMQVGGDASMPYSDASRVSKYLLMVEPADAR